MNGMTTTPSTVATPTVNGTGREKAGPGAWSGADFIESLRDGRAVWSEGTRVDVVSDGRFRPMLTTLADLFDRRRTPAQADRMLYRSASSGNLVSPSYLAPRSREELDQKWVNSESWAAESHGQLSRLPDFVANVVVGLYDFRFELAKINPEFGTRAENYYHYCREHDIVLTHGLGDPQVDRSATPIERPELGLRVIERSADGIVVRGAKGPVSTVVRERVNRAWGALRRTGCNDRVRRRIRAQGASLSAR